MVYNNNLVTCVKVDGKVLRDKDSTVEIPFNTEYSLFLKNLSNRRVVINVEIDGVDIGNGDKLVIEPNKYLNLERYISNNNCFKFIEKTREISDYRGDRPEDGLIRIIYSYEKETIKYPYYHPYHPNWHETVRDSTGNDRLLRYTDSTSCDINSFSTWTTQTNNLEWIKYNEAINNKDMIRHSSVDGITVPGSKSNQQFNIVENFEVENEYHVIVIRLIGCKNDNQLVQEPLLVKTKLICPTCGKKCSSYDRFCSRCGTALD